MPRGLTRFYPCKVNNNWEYLTYSYNDLGLDEKRGGVCDIRYPDGTVKRNVHFVSQEFGTSYCDMGVTSHVRAYRMGFYDSHHGRTVFVPLNEVFVRNVVQ